MKSNRTNFIRSAILGIFLGGALYQSISLANARSCVDVILQVTLQSVENDQATQQQLNTEFARWPMDATISWKYSAFFSEPENTEFCFEYGM